tara:strand:+ start:404 stop:1372 length:969 start_codon:yes stop_codon:yes gene_type:complete
MEGIMSLEKLPPWAERHNYFHHSNPSMPDGYTFYNKCFVRPLVDHSWKVLKGELNGDKEQAQQIIDKHKNENPNMHSGVVVQEYCDDILLHGVNDSEAYRSAVAKIQEFTPLPWHDVEKEEAIIKHRLEEKYALKQYKGEDTYRKDAEGEHCELQLVCKHALQGLKQASEGINQLTGETDLLKVLPGTTLPYNGRPDYHQRIELKTMWDQMAHTDSPKANSIPKEPRFSHLTQIAGYWHLSGQLPTIVYANRNGFKVYKPAEDELRSALEYLIESCQRRERLLEAAKTTRDLLRLTDPDWDHMFAWKDVNPDVLGEAKQIWR